MPELDQVLELEVVVVLVTNLQMIVLLTEEHLVPMVTKLEAAMAEKSANANSKKPFKK